MQKILSFSLALVLFVLFDFVWLGFVMDRFNLSQLAEIGRIENGVFSIRYPAAFAAYFLMALAIPLFVLPKLSRNDSVPKAFLNGALLGLIIYGVYDMTNLAIIKNYPLLFVVPDVVWGTFVFGLVTVISMKFVNS